MPVYDDQKSGGNRPTDAARAGWEKAAKNVELANIKGRGDLIKNDPAYRDQFMNEAIENERRSNAATKAKLQDLEQSYGRPSAANSGSEKLKEQDDLEKAYNAPDATESGSEKLKKKEAGGESGGNDSFFKRIGTKKNARRGGIGGILLLGFFGGAFGLFTIMSGPGQVIQWAEDLKAMQMGRVQSVTDSRSSKHLLYALAGVKERGRLGKVGNFVADRYEKRMLKDLGLKPVYSPITKRMIGLEITDQFKAADFKKDMPTTKTVQGQMYDSKGFALNEGGNEMIDLTRDTQKTKREFVKLANKHIGSNPLYSKIGSRLLIKRYGVPFHPLNPIRRKLDEKLADYQKRVQKDQADKATGRTNVGGVDTPEKKSVREKFGELKGRLQALIKTAKGPLIAVGAICGLKAFSGMIDAQNINNFETMLRSGMMAVNVGSQVEGMKDFDLEQIGAIANTLYDPKTKTSVTDDPGVQHESGQKMTGFDYTSKMRPTADNSKPWFFDVVDFVGAPLTPVCDLISDVSNAVSNLPVISQALGAVQWLIDAGLKLFTGKTMDQLVQAGVDFFATQAIPDVPVGAMKGGIENTGLRAAMNDQMLTMGGRTLTDPETQAVQASVKEEQKQQFASASMYDRYLNVSVPGSAFGSILMTLPRSRSQFFANMQRLPIQMANMLSSTLGLSKAFAAPPTTYDYGFKLIGFSTAELDDPKYDNGFDNEAYILEGDRLDRMNDTYGKDCFFMTIDHDGNLTHYPPTDPNHRPSKCDDTTDPEYKAYRYYKADLISGFEAACHEGDEDSCAQVGMGPQTAATAAAPGTAGATGQVDMGTIFQASDTMQCAAGTDEGVQDGYRKNVLTKVKICNVQGIRVNARISANIDALMTAARAAGINFTGSGFATMAQQQAKYNNNCKSGTCNPPTATPGTSNHQMGLAIDFSQDGKLLSSSQSGFGWLKTNAATYGLQNLPSENWHWSVDGG